MPVFTRQGGERSQDVSTTWRQWQCDGKGTLLTWVCAWLPSPCWPWSAGLRKTKEVLAGEATAPRTIQRTRNVGTRQPVSPQSLHLLDASEHLQCICFLPFCLTILFSFQPPRYCDFTTQHHQINHLSTCLAFASPHPKHQYLLSLIESEMFYGSDSTTKIYWAPTLCIPRTMPLWAKTEPSRFLGGMYLTYSFWILRYLFVNVFERSIRVLFEHFIPFKK